jgi:UDP-glucuronate 4-epimerase
MKKFNINLKNKVILITKACSFIGVSLISKLIHETHGENTHIIGIDDMHYYSSEKIERFNTLKANKRFLFVNESLTNKEAITELFSRYHIDLIIHLSATNNFDKDIENENDYFNKEIIGISNLLSVTKNCTHFVFTSSINVYGSQIKIPFTLDTYDANPINITGTVDCVSEIYARWNSHTFNIPTTCLRLGSVYGPMDNRNKPYLKLADKLINEGNFDIEKFELFTKNYIYIDDVVECIFRILQIKPDNSINNYRTFNVTSEKDYSYNEIKDILIKELSNLNININDTNNKLDISTILSTKNILKNECKKEEVNSNEIYKEIEYEHLTDINSGMKSFLLWYLK